MSDMPIWKICVNCGMPDGGATECWRVEKGARVVFPAGHSFFDQEGKEDE